MKGLLIVNHRPISIISPKIIKNLQNLRNGDIIGIKGGHHAMNEDMLKDLCSLKPDDILELVHLTGATVIGFNGDSLIKLRMFSSLLSYAKECSKDLGLTLKFTITDKNGMSSSYG